MNLQRKTDIDARLPLATPGFESINRYWDKHLDMPAAKILPGEIYVSKNREIITTVLGSCISACIRDKVTGVGGMNHFMLPSTSTGKDSWQGSNVSAPMRYGEWAMEFLLNEIYKYGGKKKNLEVKIFGGGKIMNNMTDIGEKNIMFVLDFLAREELEIVSQDIGDICPRKVIYFSNTGKVKLRRLRNMHNKTIEEREIKYIKTLTAKEPVGEVELF